MKTVVILGGFLSRAGAYATLRRDLGALTGRRILIVDSKSRDWLASSSRLGWVILLSKPGAILGETL